MKFGFIGLGLIGGSIAKTIRRIMPEAEIVAYNRTASVSEKAEKEGVITRTARNVDESFAGCDYIFLCVPVITMLSYIEQLKPFLTGNTILTDVGSTKGDIHSAVASMDISDHFIGGHPMAGSEKTGFDNATDRMIENAYYILTPGEGVSVSAVGAFSELISRLGALPLILTSEEHDYVTGAISHLPHVISASLVNLVHELDGPEKHMKSIAAGGFKDITRISSSSPTMWQEICLANGENICILLDKYIRKLIDFRFVIRNGDAERLYDFFSECKDYRDSFTNESPGPIKKVYRFYLDLEDEAGAIARIAAILAEAGISIRNIGIEHNREFEAGVLRVEFYSEAQMKTAAALLKQKQYTLYEG